MDKIIDGKEMARKVRAELAEKVLQTNAKPVLAVIIAGNNEASRIYVRNKKKAAEEAKIECRVFELPEDVGQAEIEALIIKLNEDKDINGILIQQPLPKQIDNFRLLELVNPEKDVDGFCPTNIGLLVLNSPEAIIAATPKGVLKMIKSVCSDLAGKNAVVIGRSNIVGKPLSALLLNNDCTVTTAHSKTRDLEQISANADILVAACGQAKIVKKDWVKKGAIVIDVGINKENDKLCGDVDFDDVKNEVSFISPVPGGVGPMTIAMLLENTVEAYLKQHKK